MSYARLTEKEKILADEVSALLNEADRVDRAEDARYGTHRRGDALPEELARRETRLAKLREAKAALAAEAAQAAAATAAERARANGKPDAEVAAAAVGAAAQAVPKPKAQRNFTDPESRIMLTGDGSFQQCDNGQAVVDDTAQVIVAADVTACAADVGQLLPLLDQVEANTGAAPRALLADAGYCSTDNLTALAERPGTTSYIATGRLRHGETVPPAPRGRIPAAATPRERMARRLRTKPGRAAYARRKAIVEPVVGQLKICQNGRQLLLRGRLGAELEWQLLCATHNIRKLFSHLGVAGLATLPTG